MPNTQWVPPRVGYYTHDFRDGKGPVRIKVVRASKWCKWLKLRAFTFWNRIYIRDNVIVRKRLIRELSILRVQRKQGFWKALWNVRKTNRDY